MGRHALSAVDASVLTMQPVFANQSVALTRECLCDATTAAGLSSSLRQSLGGGALAGTVAGQRLCGMMAGQELGGESENITVTVN